MCPARIIFLHGASSSGKSTLARAIQDTAKTPFLHLSIDHFRESGVLPQNGLENGRWSWRDMRAPVFEGFHRAVAGFAHAGNDIVLEHILDTPGWHRQLQALLTPFDVLFVGIHCALDVLDMREQRRGDRPLGSAANDFAHIHSGLTYDLNITGTEPPAPNAARVLAAMDSTSMHSAFFAPT